MNIFHVTVIVTIVLAILFILQPISFYEFSFRRLKLRFFHREAFPIITVKPSWTFPWEETTDEFTVFLDLPEDCVYFKYGSTEEALVLLSDKHIKHDYVGGIDSTICPSCGEEKHPLSGASGKRTKFRIEETVMICIDCSQWVRRELVRQGTPTHTTADILTQEWENVPMDGL